MMFSVQADQNAIGFDAPEPDPKNVGFAFAALVDERLR
jgi:hypothetical protein